ncbi:MAG: hypothetical protein AUK47_21695 [Deltaproteobacteria bacterium CG2_30_63_29]|nr:MAG: hypothetical protein AUK47_21695 [Deltaproteobacteria bacterium CG2_30_63_29]PIW00045.1 MAG: hypothetical protein COW42_09110 [Deltaproteobacteria bacterium CG17_big_fil_post_rev_8_21_14_2_50_63_7]PJB46586.1 MAG: hypothetical protein CO108_05625 [Deltaproteobacteria bacterium CG_4_9_14_3_um_filter_63_12]
MSFRSVFAVPVLISLIALLMMGCVGPIWSTADIMSAENALKEAEAVNATTKAPYEYYRAQELLRKANEEWGYSEFGKSRSYAEAAKDFADKARTKANTDPWVGPPTSAISQ